MAEGDVTLYNDFKEQLFLGIHDLDTHVIQWTLHTGYTPDIDTHQVWADTGVSTTEYGTGSGYTAGGMAPGTQSVTQDNTNDRALLDHADPSWTALGPLTPATPSHALFWNTTQTVPADPLIGYVELGVTATNGGDYTIVLSAAPAAIVSLT